MKVGTDGTLLGAWARGGQRILDIGTGTGLIALMMAQRFPESRIVAVDIDAACVDQASRNVAASPFGNIQVLGGDVKTLQLPMVAYDAIVANPPYFEDSLICPDSQRATARHTTTLTYRELMETCVRWLDKKGELSVVIPFDCRARLETEAALAGFHKIRECAIRTTPRKSPRRYLLAFSLHAAPLEQEEGLLETAPGVRSDWYQQLTKDFYL